MSKRRVINHGDKFNKLTFIKELDPKIHKSKNRVYRSRVGLWKCECGNINEIIIYSVVAGHTKTCGCLHKEVCRKLLTTHGMFYHPLRHVLTSMMSRCYNKNKIDYHRYGGRGVTICSEWRNSYPDFLIWAITNGWKPGLTIERIDNNGNYSQDNCRFATRLDQANNTRSNRIITFKSKEYTMAQFCRKFNFNYKNFSYRIYKGQTVDEIYKSLK